MSVAALKHINDSFKSLGINYEFGTWTSDVVYPYFVGEYQEMPSVNEDGLQETTFMVTGFSRGSWLDLEQAREKIESHFGKIGGDMATTESGSVVAVFYDSTLVIPTGDAELKKIQINLTIKEWSVKK